MAGGGGLVGISAGGLVKATERPVSCPVDDLTGGSSRLVRSITVRVRTLLISSGALSPDSG